MVALASPRPRRRAFTLVELLIVVAIIGVLAALASYGVRKYVLQAKTTEAKNALGMMAKKAKMAYDRESMTSTLLQGGSSAVASSNLCDDASSPVPAQVAQIAGRKYQSTDAEWFVDAATPGKGFACLKFSVSDAQYYQYAYFGSTGDTGRFTAEARGDLDGNGVTSVFRLTGAVTNRVVLVSPNFDETAGEE